MSETTVNTAQWLMNLADKKRLDRHDRDQLQTISGSVNALALNVAALTADRDRWKAEAGRLRKGLEDVRKHQEVISQSPLGYRLSSTWRIANTILEQHPNDEATPSG